MAKANILAVILSSLTWGASVLSAAQPAGSTAPSSALPRQVELKLEAVPSALEYSSFNLNVANAPFAREPALSPQGVFRRMLPLGRDTNNALGLVWDRTRGKLYLDLNRNRDLTDDPAGVFTATNQDLRQTFTNIALVVNTTNGPRGAVVDLSLFSEASGTSLYARLALRSLWRAKVDFQGRAWEISLGDQFPWATGSNGPFFLLRPWESRAGPVSFQASWTGVVPVPRRLFWQGQAFDLAHRLETRGKTTLCTIEFTPQQPPLTDLTIAGESLDHVVFTASNGYTVVLAEPRGTVKIPSGDYAVSAVWLKQGSVEAFRLLYPPVPLKATAGAGLRLGGPLTNSVTLTRHRKDLVLTHSLLGADGGRYLLTDRDPAHPPEFAIYRGDEQVAADKFRYG
jgi:hypothetical protein